MRHQGNFAKMPRSFIGCDHLLQNFVTPCGMSLDNATGLKAHGDSIDNCALMRERFGAGHTSFDTLLVRRCEDLLGRHIWDTVQSVSRRAAAAQPKVIIGQTNPQISAWSVKMQRRIALVIQPVCT